MHLPSLSWEHVQIFLSGSTVLAIVAHAVNTYPTPKSPLGQWFLGCIQFAVGQRLQGKQTIGGQDNVTLLAKQAIDPPAKLEVIAETAKKAE